MASDAGIVPQASKGQSVREGVPEWPCAGLFAGQSVPMADHTDSQAGPRFQRMTQFLLRLSALTNPGKRRGEKISVSNG